MKSSKGKKKKEMKLTDQILQGDAFTLLKSFESCSVDCVITSPPYFKLRDYNIEKQIGQENTIYEYIDKLIAVFNECKRVLKKEGTIFVVLGDMYNDGCLLNVPGKFTDKMIDSDWILRNILIWKKPNCIPSSIKNRFTIDYEKILFFTKSKKYYFKTQYEPVSEAYIERSKYSYGGNKKNVAVTENCKPLKNSASRVYFSQERMITPNPNGRIKRSIWSIPIKPFSEAHFATFPEELVKQCLDAGCPDNGIVLDPFMGAGTTALVALKNNRKFIGIELNPEYIKIANKRIDKYLNQSNLIGGIQGPIHL